MNDNVAHTPDRQPSRDNALTTQIDQLLQREAGIFVAVRVAQGVVHLDGLVESAEQRDAATDLATAVAGVVRVENDLDVEEFDLSEAAADAATADASYQIVEAEPAVGGAFQDLPSFAASEPAAELDADMTADAQAAVEEGIPYSPPTDPVIRPVYGDQELAVVTGFGATAMDEYPDALSTTALGEAPPGDEDLREQVAAALRADAATTDLAINVHVHHRIVRLRGRVPTLDDVEAAEEVAGRVPAVREVIEELEVAALE